MIDVFSLNVKLGLRQTPWGRPSEELVGLWQGTSDLLLFKLMTSIIDGGDFLKRCKQEQGWRDARLSSSKSCTLNVSSATHHWPSLTPSTRCLLWWPPCSQPLTWLKKKNKTKVDITLVTWLATWLKTSPDSLWSLGTLQQSLLARLIEGSCCGGDRPWRTLSFQQRHASSWWMLALKALLNVYKCDDYAAQ